MSAPTGYVHTCEMMETLGFDNIAFTTLALSTWRTTSIDGGIAPSYEGAAHKRIRSVVPRGFYPSG